MTPRVISEKSLCEGQYQRLTLLTWVDARGRERTWECSRRQVPGAVLMIAVTPEGDLLLVRQFRPPMNAYVLELPAGLTDQRGEAQVATAARELEEETGYRPGRVELLAEGPVSPGMGSEYIWVYLCRDLVQTAPRPDDGEDIEIVRVPFATAERELLALHRAGQMMDLKVFGLLGLARMRE